MTYRRARGLVEAGATAAAAVAILIVPLVAGAGLGIPTVTAIGALVFAAIFAARNRLAAALDKAVYQSRFRKPETKIILDFCERVGVCFTILDLVEAVRDKLERQADMGVIFLRSNTWEIIYQSPSAAVNDAQTIDLLGKRFRELSEGFCFISDDLTLASSNEGARGFLINAKGFHFFVFTRLCPLIELEAFRTLYGEIRIYFDRVITISDLFEVASLSKEWELIAETQRSFLPRSLPKVEKLELSVVYRPLINVSGDYYDVIPVDESRTLLLIGDVSGKGLAAALIMGIIVNTVRVAKDKTDLPALVRNIDASVREMGFDDKYTVLFIGIVDTKERTLRYVNAAMADPIIVSQTALGPRIRRLEPTMGIVGLVPLEGEIEVEEQSLRTDEIILLASDGVTEVADDSGARLGEIEIFERTILQNSKVGADEFVAAVSGLLYTYMGDKPLKDDVTILAAKVGRLWD
jgi:serine phosphatase RsbU (regulator of sigma subunit)